jgi:hypothetical protein
MEEIRNKDLQQKMAQWFRRFSDQVTGSPMYRDLCLIVIFGKSNDTRVFRLIEIVGVKFKWASAEKHMSKH